MNYFDVRDAVHKTIRFSEEEKRLIDHAYVQRLRHIRQLGFVPMVYPSATHDRFSHSLGTMHVAGLLCAQILGDSEDSALARILSLREKEFITRILRICGLLHDLGHAPFSHSAEGAMPPATELAIPAAWWSAKPDNRRARHEDYSVLLIAGMAQGKDAVLSQDEARIVASLIHHKAIHAPASWEKHFSRKVNARSLHALAANLISSDIDADRMDYLLRDSHGAGVIYGHYDLAWLVSNLGVAEDQGGYVMTISETGVHALEHYLLARYNMYTSVYMHKTSKCFEYYFRKALEEREIEYAIPTAREEFAALRDSTLVEAFFRAEEQNPLSWSGRIVRREPARRVARIWAEEREVRRVYEALARNLKPHKIEPFLAFSRSKFLDQGRMESTPIRPRGFQSSLFDERAVMMPIKVLREQFGIRSLAPLADYSFILRHYHQDISVGDIYILREEYEAKESQINRILAKYRSYAADETLIEEDGISAKI